MAQSVGDLAENRAIDTGTMIEDEVDRLAERLAAFCFEHLEADVNLRKGTRSDAAHTSAKPDRS